MSKNGHDGAVGHALEDLFGLKRNHKIEADFGLFELKSSTPKMSFGDWSPDLGAYHIGRLRPPVGKKGKLEYLKDYGVKNKSGKSHVTGPYYGTQEGSKNHLRLVIRNNNLYLHDFKKNRDVIGWSYDRLKKFIATKFGTGFVVPRIKEGVYFDLDFYLGFDIECFYDWIRKGIVIYDPNTSLIRPYSQFRFRGKTSMASLICTNYKEYKKIL